jgi:hypothetical protein
MGITFRVNELCLARFVVTMKNTAEMQQALSAMLEWMIRSHARFTSQ